MRTESRIQRLSTHPSVIYAYISPSGGLKLGILTDFECEDAITIKGRFKIAYELVRDALADFLKDVKKLDEACKRISQGCYLSYDPDAYYNPNCEPLLVHDNVLAIESEREKEATQREHFQKTTIRQRIYAQTSSDFEENEILECLASIPQDLSYKERLPINLALATHFGSGAREILLNHWTGVEDKEKLEKDIDQQILDNRGEITIATLFYIAKEHYGYNPSKSRVPFPIQKPPTFEAEEYYSPEACTKRLKNIILHEFFSKKSSKVVIVESGAGKTRTLIESLVKHLSENQFEHIAIFLKTHKMINQFISDLRDAIRSYNENMNQQHGLVQGLNKSFPFHLAPQTIKSMKSACHVYDEDMIAEFGSGLCTDCHLFQEDECRYHEQFSDRLNNLRIYTHDRLFHKPRYDRGFKPHYIIVDEDITGKMAGRDAILVSETGSEFPSLNKIIQIVWAGHDLRDAASRTLDSLSADSFSASEKYKAKQAELRTKSQAQEANPDKHEQLKRDVDKLRKIRGLFQELQQLAVGTKLQSKYVWMQESEKNKEPPKLIFGEKKTLLSEYDDVPLLYMDASGEKDIIEAGLGREMEYEHLRVTQQPNAKVFQFTNQASFSKISLVQRPETMKELESWIETLDARKIGLIRYKNAGSEDGFFKSLDRIVTQRNGGERRIGWFGNIRGLNSFEDCDTLIVLGQHRLPSYSISNLTQLFFRVDIFDPEDVSLMDDGRLFEARAPVLKVYRLKEGHNQGVYQTDYIDPLANIIANHFDKAETYQALHRLRLVHGDEPKTVYILADPVLDVSLDGLLDRWKEFGDKHLQIIKYIRREKFLDDKNDQSFVDALGWTEAAAENFRGSNPETGGSGLWLKSHRSVRHWLWESKRKKGKLYAWHDQNEHAVRRWLSSKGIVAVKLTENSVMD